MKETHKYWYIVGTSIFTFIYIMMVTFHHIDKEQQRFADMALGILVGTILTGGMSYLIGGSALPHDPKSPTNKNKMAQVFWDDLCISHL